MLSVNALVICLADFIGHIGKHIDEFDGFMEAWCRSEEFGRNNFPRVLFGEKIMHVKYMV